MGPFSSWSACSYVKPENFIIIIVYTHRCDPFEPRGPGANRAIAIHHTTEVKNLPAMARATAQSPTIMRRRSAQTSCHVRRVAALAVLGAGE